ncbi:MAG: RNase H1/viroplasmin domain-containing protein [Clostridiales bacterium]|nr:RNase H1/viroplasmin domain-containing protein [Clostridiales bacterium]
MAKKQKFYAVKKGNNTGIFLTWEECQDATKGFSGPEFKSFESEQEAQAYINCH